MKITKEKYREYLSHEYRDAKLAVCRNCNSSTLTDRQLKKFNDEIVNNTIQRCLGVALFVQYLDVPYDFSEAFYEETRGKLEGLRDFQRAC